MEKIIQNLDDVTWKKQCETDAHVRKLIEEYEVNARKTIDYAMKTSSYFQINSRSREIVTLKPYDLDIPSKACGFDYERVIRRVAITMCGFPETTTIFCLAEPRYLGGYKVKTITFFPKGESSFARHLFMWTGL